MESNTTSALSRPVIPLPELTTEARDQLAIAQRLHTIATAVRPSDSVCCRASDLLALINGFWHESLRADQALANLNGRLEARPN